MRRLTGARLMLQAIVLYRPKLSSFLSNHFILLMKSPSQAAE